MSHFYCCCFPCSFYWILLARLLALLEVVDLLPCQVKFSREHERINFPSHATASFPHSVFLILRMCHLSVVPIHSPCYFLPLFCIRTRFGISRSLWLCNVCHGGSTKARTEWLSYLKFQLAIALNKKLWLPCDWHSASLLGLDLHRKFNRVVAVLTLPVGREARRLVAAPTGFLFHLPGFPVDHSQACWLHSLGQFALCFLCSACLKKRRLKFSVLSINHFSLTLKTI